MNLVIIGAGPGAYETAIVAAKSGLNVTLIHEDHLGGTCLNEGCIPTKTLCKNAEVLDELKSAQALGIDNLSYTFNFEQVQRRKNDVIAQLRCAIKSLISIDNLTEVIGKARFKTDHIVVVDDKEYYADYIIIATGSVSASLPIEGANLPCVLNSTSILELEKLPKSLCVIGAGVIGLEFASIFNSFGVNVTVLEYCKEVLPHFDTDLAKRFKQCLSKKGIDIQTSSQVMSISQSDSQVKIKYLTKKGESEIIADKVLMAVGRRPNVESLNLSDIGIDYSVKGIFVDKDMRTNLPHIFAVGDIVGGLMLAHVASTQSKIALDVILDELEIDKSCKRNKIRLEHIPAAVFTHPELACVGLTEDVCKESNIDYFVTKSFYRANGKALAMNETDGYCKIIFAHKCDKYKEGQILGCHIFGQNSSDIIHEIVALMRFNGTYEDLSCMIHGHPTLSEVLAKL